MNIILDAMGGDYAPEKIVEGAVYALQEFPQVYITLIGIESQVRDQLTKHQYSQDRLEIVHAPEVIGMKDPAISPIRKKKNSSISIGIRMLKEQPDKYSAFISAGNTGAVVSAATVFLGMLPKVERPAIGLVLPTLKRFSFLIDVGANIDPKPKHLLQSALMASVYAQKVLEVKDPRVGLLNIGSEESKGSDFVKETHKLFLENLPNFAGNIEASEIFKGECDCVITDGYTGNIVIKISQSLMESTGALIKRELKKSPIAMFGAMLIKAKLSHVKKRADYAEYGGAPLLGVNGLVMISHGRSDARAIKNAIRATIHEIENNIISAIISEVT